MLDEFREATRSWIAEHCPEGARGSGQIPFGSRRVNLEPDVADWLNAMVGKGWTCLLYTSPSPRDGLLSRMPSSA